MFEKILIAAAAMALVACGATATPAPGSVTLVPKAYVVIEITLTDPVEYEQYKSVIEPLILEHGGRYVARGGRTETIDPPAPAGRVVLLEFPSFEAAMAFENDPRALAASDIRHRSSKSRIYVVEGVSP